MIGGNMFAKRVLQKLSAGGFVGVLLNALPKGKLVRWDPNLVELPSNTLCRGITRQELDAMLKTGQIQTRAKPEDKDVAVCDYAEEVYRGFGGLLSFATKISTSNLYGANRKALPRDGAILVTAKPAFYVPTSEHVRICPELCAKYQEQLENDYWNTPADERGKVVDIAKLAIGCDEVTAVVGHHAGVDFSNMLDVNTHVHTIYHIFGSGRGVLIDAQSCLIEKFHNKDYKPRALNFELALTQDRALLAILESRMRQSGSLALEHRILTLDDAAVIMQDQELHQLLTTPTDLSGSITVVSAPKELTGAAMVSYLKTNLQPQLALLQEPQGMPILGQRS